MNDNNKHHNFLLALVSALIIGCALSLEIPGHRLHSLSSASNIESLQISLVYNR